MWICPNDDTKNKDEDLFCACCGEQRPFNLDDDSSSDTATVNTKPQEEHKAETDTDSEYRYVYRKARHTATTKSTTATTKSTTATTKSTTATTRSAKENRPASERTSSSTSRPEKTVRPEPAHKTTPPSAAAYRKAPRRRYLYEKLLWFWYAGMLIGLLVFSIGAGAGLELFSFDGKFEDILSEIWFFLAVIPAALSFLKRSPYDKTAQAPKWHGVLIAFEFGMLFIFGLGLAEELRSSFMRAEDLVFMLAGVPHLILTVQLIRDRGK